MWKNRLKLSKFFTPPTEKFSNVYFSSLMSEGTEMFGDIVISNNMRIDGHLTGRIAKKRGSPEPITVIVSKSGKVSGAILADIIIIEGEMDGTTKANIALYVNGKIKGKAYYGDVLDVSGEATAQFKKLTAEQINLVPKVITENVEQDNPEKKSFPAPLTRVV